MSPRSSKLTVCGFPTEKNELILVVFRKKKYIGMVIYQFLANIIYLTLFLTVTHSHTIRSLGEIGPISGGFQTKAKTSGFDT